MGGKWNTLLWLRGCEEDHRERADTDFPSSPGRSRTTFTSTFSCPRLPAQSQPPPWKTPAGSAASLVPGSVIPSWEQPFSANKNPNKPLQDPYRVPPGSHHSSVSLSKLKPSGNSWAFGEPRPRCAHLVTQASRHQRPASADFPKPQGTFSRLSREVTLSYTWFHGQRTTWTFQQ